MNYEVGGKITLGSGENAKLLTITDITRIDAMTTIQFDTNLPGLVISEVIISFITGMIECGAATYSPPVKAPEPIVETFEGVLEFRPGGLILGHDSENWSVCYIPEGYSECDGWHAHVTVTLTPPRENVQ